MLLTDNIDLFYNRIFEIGQGYNSTLKFRNYSVFRHSCLVGTKSRYVNQFSNHFLSLSMKYKHTTQIFSLGWYIEFVYVGFTLSAASRASINGAGMPLLIIRHFLRFNTVV